MHTILTTQIQLLQFFCKIIFNMIVKCIMCPVDQTDFDYAGLNESDHELLSFHQAVFGVREDGWINNIFFDIFVNSTTLISRVLSHANCLHRQCQQECGWQEWIEFCRGVKLT